MTVLCIARTALAQTNVVFPDEQKVYAVSIAPMNVYEVSTVNAERPPDKHASFKLKFIILAQDLTIKNVKYYRISFLQITKDQDAERLNTFKSNYPNFIDETDNGKEFYVSETELLAKCKPSYALSTQAAIGFVSLPYQTRFGKKDVRPADNDLGVNILPALEVKWRINSFYRDTYFGLLLAAGVTTANVSASQFPATSTQKDEYKTPKGVSLVSMHFGPFFSIKGGYFAVLFGYPFSPSSLSEWNYYKAGTLSLGIGVSIFKLSSEGTANSQSSPSTSK